MTYATTFSGIGGWELGLNACGWKLQWQCERDRFCRVLLNERFGVPIYDDIRTICEQSPTRVDALIGSPPCQPFSVAGKKGGIGDERHLYPSFIRLVGQIKPRWVLMEQVPAILGIERGRAFGGYLAGLAAFGYSIVWHCIPVCAVGANHQRDRIWIIAYESGGFRRGSAQGEAGQFAQLCKDSTGERRGETRGDSERSEERVAGGCGVLAAGRKAVLRGMLSGEASRPRNNLEQLPTLRDEQLEHKQARVTGALTEEAKQEDVPDGARELRHCCREEGDGRAESADGSVDDANSMPTGERRFARTCEVKGAALPDAGSAGCEEFDAPGFAAKPGHGAGGFVAGGTNWAIEPDVGRVAHGVPFRVDRLKGLGNAVVPQIPFVIGQSINKIEAEHAA